MKRALTLTALVAMGLLVASSYAAAQNAPAKTTGGEVSVAVLGATDISSAKFSEYREIPTGVSIPYMNLFSQQQAFDFNLQAYKVRQSDQRYTGWFDTSAFGVAFDYNQIPHNMGYEGRTMYAESAPGVWTMSQSLRQSLQTAVQNQLPTSTRTYAFYSTLLAPTLASANSVDISSLRQRGTAAFDFGRKLPFDLSFTYLRELKSGYRGPGGGNIRGTVNPSYEVMSPLNELTQDIGVRAAYNFKAGNVYASFNRNLYNNRADTLTIDNPFQAFDAPVVSGVGGPASDRIVMAPDNEASTGSAGFLLKFARQTRIGGAVSMATWTQDAPFYPYTANTAVLTPSGAAAASLSTLQQKSYNGKVDRAMWNFSFSSRPVKGLGIRAQYRAYDLTDKSGRWVSTGDMSVPHQNWNVVVPNASQPYGRLTANPYDTTSSKFTASASYDFGDLTLEGAFHNNSLTRTYREATEGTDSGYLLAAIYRSSDWLNFRVKYEDSTRTAEGHTVYGYQMDEAERDMTRTWLQVDLTPIPSLGLSFAYQRRNVDFPNRPDRVQVSGGVPVAGALPIPGTPSGLLEASYDSFTVEAAYTPNDRTDFLAYYTYEKDGTTNQWSTTTGANLNNLLNYVSSNKADTFGANARFVLVPEKWTFSLMLQSQQLDGLMDITAREAGSFYTPGRTTLIPAGQGGAADITDWDDTELTTFGAQLEYMLAKAWTMSAGYLYEKYDFRDAYNSTDLLMPQAVYIFLKADNGAYTANVAYAKLSYRF
ncbi:MAG: MtrB/PioB family outer membrane beta-barrel protein [Vicinamibacterales bacterium]